MLARIGGLADGLTELVAGGFTTRKGRDDSREKWLPTVGPGRRHPACPVSVDAHVSLSVTFNQANAFLKFFEVSCLGFVLCRCFFVCVCVCVFMEAINGKLKNKRRTSSLPFLSSKFVV